MRCLLRRLREQARSHWVQSPHKICVDI